MIRIASETDLLECFRPLDRPEVELPPGLKFPFLIKDYLAWTDPSGYRTCLVFRESDTRKALGVVFRRDQAGGGTAGMCEWCHSVRAGNGVGLLTASASANRRVGVQVCRQLSCKEKAESAPGPDDMPPFLAPRERIARITRRMSEFARRNLF